MTLPWIRLISSSEHSKRPVEAALVRTWRDSIPSTVTPRSQTTSAQRKPCRVNRGSQTSDPRPAGAPSAASTTPGPAAPEPEPAAPGSAAATSGPAAPRRMYWSVWRAPWWKPTPPCSKPSSSSASPAVRCSGSSGQAYMFDRLSRRPSARRPWPWRTVTRPPAGPLTRSRVHPVRFCPKSQTVASPAGSGLDVETGSRVRITRMGGSGWARSAPDGASAGRAGAQARSSKPGSAQPGCSRRAS